MQSERQCVSGAVLTMAASLFLVLAASSASFSSAVRTREAEVIRWNSCGHIMTDKPEGSSLGILHG